MKPHTNMTIKRLKELRDIAEVYKMYPLVHYYELNIQFNRLRNRFENSLKEQYEKTGHGSSMHY